MSGELEQKIDRLFVSLVPFETTTAAEATQAIKDLIHQEVMAVIGKDEYFKCGAGALCDGDMCCSGETYEVDGRNRLRAEQRQKLKEITGGN